MLVEAAADRKARRIKRQNSSNLEVEPGQNLGALLLHSLKPIRN